MYVQNLTTQNHMTGQSGQRREVTFRVYFLTIKELGTQKHGQLQVVVNTGLTVLLLLLYRPLYTNPAYGI